MKRVFAPLALVLSLLALAANLASAQEESKTKEEPKPAAPADAAPADAANADPAKPESPAATTPPAVDPGASTKAADDHGKGDGHGHAHDETDLTHANASAQLHKPEEFRFDQALATFVIFLLLTAILAKFAWGPITDGLDKREQNIAKMIDDARLAQEQAEAQLRSYETKLAAAAEEARVTVAKARQDAEATRERERAETKALLEKDRQQAKDEIEAAKNAALQQIAEKSVSTAISLASSIVRREIKPEDHDKLVTDALGKFTKLN